MSDSGGAAVDGLDAHDLGQEGIPRLVPSSTASISPDGASGTQVLGGQRGGGGCREEHSVRSAGPDAPCVRQRVTARRARRPISVELVFDVAQKGQGPANRGPVPCPTPHRFPRASLGCSTAVCALPRRYPSAPGPNHDTTNRYSRQLNVYAYGYDLINGTYYYKKGDLGAFRSSLPRIPLRNSPQ